MALQPAKGRAKSANGLSQVRAASRQPKAAPAGC